MQRCKEILNKYLSSYKDFEYYLKIISTIEEHVDTEPDKSIEACNSLVAGVSKTILNKFNKPYKEVGRDADTTSKLFSKTIECLSSYDKFEAELVRSLSMVFGRISSIRNSRGDISHGRAVPKNEESSKEVSNLVMNLTDLLMAYTLNIFFNTDWSFLDIVKYEDNREFNDILDEPFPDLGISYSRGLYDQDYTQYTQQLLDYNSDKANAK